MRLSFKRKLVIIVLLVVLGGGAWAAGRSGLCPVTGIDTPAAATGLSSGR